MSDPPPVVPVEVVKARVSELSSAPLIPFSARPDARVPRSAAGVYTIWRGEEFMYVGMAGRGMDAEKVAAHSANGKRKGLADRLNAHASGRRSGDQFCIYIADRLVLPTLSATEVKQIAAGELSLDTRIRDFVRPELAFRFVVTRDGREAAHVERAVRQGALAAGMPLLLNPFKGKVRRGRRSSR